VSAAPGLRPAALAVFRATGRGRPREPPLRHPSVPRRIRQQYQSYMARRAGHAQRTAPSA